MNEEKLKIAVFIDFDNIQIGVRSTLGRDFDLALVLEALKERGEVVTKVAYGNWKRAGELTRTLTHNAVLMVQRDLTPRGDKNGADINLALDALEMAINHTHINAFVIVGGDSDFIALVEKLKQYNKAVFVVGGRSFTSSVLQRNCREFIGYENLIESLASDRRRDPDLARRREIFPLQRAVPLVYRALKVLSDREVQAQLGLLKSTLIQLDSTFNERDFGSSSFRNFVQKMADAQLLSVRQQGNSVVVEPLEREPAMDAADNADSAAPAGEEYGDNGGSAPSSGGSAAASEGGATASASEGGTGEVGQPTPREPVASRPPEEAVELLARVLEPLRGTNPRPLYLRNVKQLLRNEQPGFDEQRHGFASLVELLRAGQTQNLLRLQRDRRGALRVFIPGPPPPAGTAGAVPASAGTSASAEAVGEENDVTSGSGEGTAGVVGDGAIASASDNGPIEPSSPPISPAPRANGNPGAPREDPDDSQIRVLGYYKGIHGEPSEEEQALSLTAAVMAEAGGHKKRVRKPKSNGSAGPRKRKPPTRG